MTSSVRTTQAAPTDVPRKRAPGPSEDALQAAIVEWLGWVAPQLIPISIANGGKRNPREAAKLKRTGTLAGAPDIVIALPGGGALWLETKTEIGRLSDEQVVVHYRLRAIVHHVFVVRSIPDVAEALRACGIQTREAA